MRMKALLAAAAIAAFSGSAIAQTTGATTDDRGGSLAGDARHWASEHEQEFYTQHGDILAGFFVDDTWMELRPEEEFVTTWSALTPDDQGHIRAACDQLNHNPAAQYEQVTRDLCVRVGEI